MTEVMGIDHIYITVSELSHSEAFYDIVLLKILGFRKNKFYLNQEPHIQYFNRYFGYVIRPSRSHGEYDSYAPGLHHLCFRVDSVDDVAKVAKDFKTYGLKASEAKQYPEYAHDYWATYLIDPDGIRLEVTNYRTERRERHDQW